MPRNIRENTAITILPFFQNAGRGMERIWGEAHSSPKPTVINWPGLHDKEKSELIPTLSSTDNWILLTHPLGAKNNSQIPLAESQRIARAEGKCSRHKGWWREGKDELASHSMTTEVWTTTRGRISEATRIGNLYSSYQTQPASSPPPKNGQARGNPPLCTETLTPTS